MLTTVNSLQNTYGLVVCGGKSSRMGRDKSMLQYYDKPQRYHVYDMLLPFCEKVFISCNEEQVGTIEEGYHFINDDAAFNDTGPMAALLSAFTCYPDKHMLVIGCDYPFLTVKELQQFATHCNNAPVSFYNEAENIYEPLLAWYPSSSFEKLKEMHKAGQFSLQYFLKDGGAIKYYPEDKRLITSVDAEEEFNHAKNLLKL